MQSYVGVDVSESGWQLSELCLDNDCSLPPLVRDQPAEYAYRLTLRNADGASIQHDGIVRTKSYRVNGEGCRPVTANAVLVVDASGAVSVRYLS